MPSNFNVVTIEIGGYHGQFSDLVFQLYIPGSGWVTLTDNLVGDSGFLLTFTEAGGLDPNGTWDLRVCDDAINGNQGWIINWCLTFELQPKFSFHRGTNEPHKVIGDSRQTPGSFVY
jgi:hypothetical protein